MILFSAFLVVVAIGLLIVGVVTSKLMLIYVAIGVSGVALLALGAGALVRRRELFGKPKAAGSEVGQPQPVAVPAPAAFSQPAVYSEPPFSQQPTAVSAASGWSAPRTAAAPVAPAAQAVPAAQAGPSRAGYLPTQQPPAGPPSGRPADVQRPPDVFTPRPAAAAAPPPQVWEWRDDAPAAQPAAPPEDQPSPQDRPSAKDEPPTADQPSAETRPPADASPLTADQKAYEDQKTAELEHPASDQPAQEPAASSGSKSGATPAATQAFPAAPPPTETAPAKPAPTAPAPPKPASAQADLQREVTVVPGVPRYHNARCILIRFMGEDDLSKMTLAAARQAGCTPCRACLPDQLEKTAEF